LYLGDIKNAQKIIDQLAAEKNDDYIDECELAKLYFLCGNFEKHNKMYDNASYGYYPDANWLSPYFYCLYILDKTDELNNKFIDIMKRKDEIIKEAKEEDLDDDETQEDKNTYIEQLQKEKRDIESAYNYCY